MLAYLVPVEVVMNEHESAALAAFKDYNAAFLALDPARVAKHFAEPALLLSPKGDFSLPKRADVERIYGEVMAEARKLGYATTDFEALEARDIGVDLASVIGRGAWKNASDEVLMRFELAYVLRRVGDAWKVVVADVRGRAT